MKGNRQLLLQFRSQLKEVNFANLFMGALVSRRSLPISFLAMVEELDINENARKLIIGAHKHYNLISLTTCAVTKVKPCSMQDWLLFR